MGEISPCMRMKLNLLMTCWEEGKDWRQCHILTPEGYWRTSYLGQWPSSSRALRNELQTINEPDGSVTFLGAKIRKPHNGHIILSVFDKTKTWTFPVTRYNHGTSSAPSCQFTVVFIGQTCVTKAYAMLW